MLLMMKKKTTERHKKHQKDSKNILVFIFPLCCGLNTEGIDMEVGDLARLELDDP